MQSLHAWRWCSLLITMLSACTVHAPAVCWEPAVGVGTSIPERIDLGDGRIMVPYRDLGLAKVGEQVAVLWSSEDGYEVRLIDGTVVVASATWPLELAPPQLFVQSDTLHVVRYDMARAAVVQEQLDGALEVSDTTELVELDPSVAKFRVVEVPGGLGVCRTLGSSSRRDDGGPRGCGTPPGHDSIIRRQGFEWLGGAFECRRRRTPSSIRR